MKYSFREKKDIKRTTTYISELTKKAVKSEIKKKDNDHFNENKS